MGGARVRADLVGARDDLLGGLALGARDGDPERDEQAEGALLVRAQAARAGGLVTRRRDSDDERRVLVAVTNSGWDLQEQVSDIPSRLVESFGLNEGATRQLRQFLGSLLDRLDGELAESTTG